MQGTSTTSIRSGSLETFSLGIVEFDSFVKLQERLVFEISGRQDDQAMLLFCEHPHCISIGRNGHPEQIEKSPRELQQIRVETTHSARGGTVIPHLPGQLAVSLIAPLEKLGHTPVSLQKLLVSCTQEVLKHFKIENQFDPVAGVITSNQAIVAYSGSRVRFGISSFGMYLNVNPWLEFFRLVKCPGDYQLVSSFNRVLMKQVESSAVRETFLKELARLLGYDKQHYYTRHPLLARTARKLLQHVPY